ncbi:MAG: hypothetical protein A2603_05140 [Bdellovibrionales bacterium RIFOXYD1_FULL_55_31]|nr:MAG: hypothetical protein A2603_05140 [Bdellovibrionales bacterium RIFOXYD1_FULL_55_31]
MLKVRQGDKKAFAQIYGKLKKPIMSYIFGFVLNHGVAEDLTQEVFLKVYRVRETYEPTARFSTWLWTVAHNTVIDHLRKKQDLLADDLFHDEAEPKSPSIELIQSELSDSEAALIENARKELVQDCLSRLSPSQKDALQLRIFSDLTYEEIATTLQVSVTSVKTLLYRAKQGILKCLNKKESGDERA